MKKVNSKNTLVERIKRYSENNPLIVVIWLVIVFLSSTITIVQGSTLIVNFAIAHVFEKQDLYNKLDSISTLTQIDYFIDKFGRPTMYGKGIKDNTRDYIFINKYFYLEATTNANNTVISYAITSRDKDFQPEFNEAGFTKIKLNVTKFSDLSKKIDNFDDGVTYPQCLFYLGARRFRYFEGYYLGNPSDYQSFYIGISDAGIISKKGLEYLPSFADKPLDYSCLQVPNSFRNEAVINTYISTAPFEYMAISSTEAAQLTLGADLDLVRAVK